MRTACTQCGACLAHCPMYRVVREEQTSPKAKHLLLDAVEREATLSWQKTLQLTRLCAGCGRCEDICPLHLSVPDTLARSRSRHLDWTSRVWAIWIRGSGLTWPLAGMAANLLPRVGTPSGLRPLVLSAKSMKSVTHPAPWLRFTSRKPTSTETVALFAGCTANAIRPQWITRARALLEKVGITIDPRSRQFSCCGATVQHAGLLEAAETFRKNNIRLWESMGRPRVAVFCASCQHGLEQYPETIFVDKDQAVSWKKAIVPLSAFLLETNETGFTADHKKTPRCVAYHQPCHRKGVDPDLALLRGALPALSMGTALCCGMGGILKLTHAGMSARLAQTCWEGLVAEGENGPAEVLSGCSGCVLQLGAFAGNNSAWHWLDAVDIQADEQPQ